MAQTLLTLVVIGSLFGGNPPGICSSVYRRDSLESIFSVNAGKETETRLTDTRFSQICQSFTVLCSDSGPAVCYFSHTGPICLSLYPPAHTRGHRSVKRGTRERGSSYSSVELTHQLSLHRDCILIIIILGNHMILIQLCIYS